MSTLRTVNNLGNLYKVQRKLSQAEEMHRRALEGYKQTIGPEIISIYVPAINNLWSLGSLAGSQGRVDEAKVWYSKALSGYEKVFGEGHTNCQQLRDSLSALDSRQPQPKPDSRRHRVLKMLGWKRV